jgi:formylglycine-generating enzyme required for sulfatase activity
MSSMVQVGDFSVDTFEAGLDEKGAATSGKHQIPATNMSWFSAKDACEASGKRLCTEAEWVTACQGKGAVDDDGDGQTADDMIEGTSYPYGDYHERGRCWDARPRGKDRLVYTGEMAGCVSADGAYDLTGNVEEWVGDSPQTAVLLGGNFETTKDHARCFRRNDTYGPGFANHRTGFRCCK